MCRLNVILPVPGQTKGGAVVVGSVVVSVVVDGSVVVLVSVVVEGSVVVDVVLGSVVVVVVCSVVVDVVLGSVVVDVVVGTEIEGKHISLTITELFKKLVSSKLLPQDALSGGTQIEVKGSK